MAKRSYIPESTRASRDIGGFGAAFPASDILSNLWKYEKQENYFWGFSFLDENRGRWIYITGGVFIKYLLRRTELSESQTQRWSNRGERGGLRNFCSSYVLRKLLFVMGIILNIYLRNRRSMELPSSPVTIKARETYSSCSDHQLGTIFSYCSLDSTSQAIVDRWSVEFSDPSIFSPSFSFKRVI